MALVYLVRHGESTWNRERRWAGQANPPLSMRGREQTLAACATLAEMNFDGIVSSSLLRSVETAQIISHTLNLPLRTPNPDFDERHAGLISGLTSDEIEAQFPGLLEAWRKGHLIQIPGGESWHLFSRRVLHSLVHLGSYPEQRLLLVVHEGVLRAIAWHFKEPYQKYQNLQGRWLDSSLLSSSLSGQTHCASNPPVNERAEQESSVNRAGDECGAAF